MGNFKYKNIIHFTNTCKKIIRECDFDIDEQTKNNILDKANHIWFFSSINNHQEFVEEKDLLPLTHSFTMELGSVRNINELKDINIMYNSLQLVNNSEMEEWLRLSNYRKFIKENSNYVIDLAYLVGKIGVYKLYNKEKELIYMGKSRDLGSRIISSGMEQGGYFFSYSNMQNESDACIYEAYYIALLKPRNNVTGNVKDAPTIKLDDLKFSNIQTFFKKDDNI